MAIHRHKWAGREGLLHQSAWISVRTTAGVTDDRRARCPLDRPMAYVRVMRNVVSRRWSLLVRICAMVGFVVTAFAVSLSDRAPRAIGARDHLVISIVRRFETILDVSIIDRIPASATTDDAGHALLWCTGVVVLGLGLRRQVPPIIIAAAAMVTGAAIEVLQATSTRTRAFELTDLVANGYGIIVGTAAVVILSALLDASEWFRGRPTRAAATVPTGTSLYNSGVRSD